MNDLVRSAKQVREDPDAVEMALACRARDRHQDGLRPRSGRLPETILVLSEHQRGELRATPARRFGSVLVFERLWKLSGCREVLERPAAERNFDFSLERAVFFTALHRLLTSGPDRSAVQTWQEDYQISIHSAATFDPASCIL
jgi:hypothetical protein